MRPTWQPVRALALMAAAFLCGCEGERPPAEVPAPFAEPDPSHLKPGAHDADSNVIDTGPFVKRFEGIAFQVPEGWQEVKLSSGLVGFVDARFVIPPQEGADDEGTVELTCLTSGGGIDENITRWIGQFDTVPGGLRTETLDVDGAQAKWVDLRGTFNGNASGDPGPHPHWRMLGAGIPAKDRACLLKLNGPEDAVAKVYDTFREFVKGARVD